MTGQRFGFQHEAGIRKDCRLNHVFKPLSCHQNQTAPGAAGSVR